LGLALPLGMTGSGSSIAVADVLTIMPMGDSITGGFHGPVELRGSYRLEMERSFLASNFQYDFVGNYFTALDGLIDGHHQGVGGYGIEQMVAQYGSVVASFQPNVVLLLAGTNNHLDPPDYENFVTRYTNLVDMIQTNSPNSLIVFSTLPKFGYHRPQSFYWTTEFVDYRNNVLFPVMNAAIYNLAANRSGVDVVDLYSILDPATDILDDDGIHPNRLGHEKLGGLFASRIYAIPEPGMLGLGVLVACSVMFYRNPKMAKLAKQMH